MWIFNQPILTKLKPHHQTFSHRLLQQSPSTSTHNQNSSFMEQLTVFKKSLLLINISNQPHPPIDHIKQKAIHNYIRMLYTTLYYRYPYYPTLR